MDTKNKIDDNKKAIEVSVVGNNILETKQTDIKGGEKETNQGLESADYEVIAGIDNKEKGVVKEQADKTKGENETAKFFKERIDVNVGDQIEQAGQAEQAIDGSKKEIKEIQEIQKKIDEKDKQLTNVHNMIEKLNGANITDYTIIDIQKELQQERDNLRKKQIEIGTRFLDNCIKEEVGIPIGNKENKYLKSSLSPFENFPNYKVKYPEVVIKALGNLYNEYNQAFAPLIEANREWSTDYQYCTPNNNSINWCVQIDMVGLPEKFLQEIKDMPEEIVREILRKRIFEIENSIAMYQLLENLFSKNKEDSFFKIHFRKVLDDLRQRFNKPIALLAVTESKYISMMETEFGKKDGEKLTNEEIKDLSGFDTFFGPKEFKEYLSSNNNQCDYLLYTRSSDPIEKLKKPKTEVMHELLNDNKIRQIIKKNTLTLNIDNPAWIINDMHKINDTKRYIPQIGMGFLIKKAEDLNTPKFITYLRTLGYNDLDKVILHCKPAVGTFGCYGHTQVTLNKKEGLQKEINQRGDYIVQPKMLTPIIINMINGKKNTYIDRNFFGRIIIGEQTIPVFLGGFRNFVPIDSIEARKGRVHGNSAIWAEILSQDKK